MSPFLWETIAHHAEPFGLVICGVDLSGHPMKPANTKKQAGRPKLSSTEALDISGLHLEWDANPEIRNRLREGGPLMEKVGEDIPSAVANVGLLQPMVTRMSLTETRPLPAVEALRDEVETIYLRNKRGSTPEDTPDVVALAWGIRKLLVFLKMKVRRREVSSAPFPHHVFQCCVQPTYSMFIIAR